MSDDISIDPRRKAFERQPNPLIKLNQTKLVFQTPVVREDITTKNPAVLFEALYKILRINNPEVLSALLVVCKKYDDKWASNTIARWEEAKKHKP